MVAAEWAEVNGRAVRFELTGKSGPVIVLVHELAGTLETYDYVVPLLTSQYRVLRYDMRGSGLSQKVRGTLKIEDLVEDLSALLDHLSICEPVVVVGCALGGAFALHFAAQRPDRAAAVIATSPATGIPPELREGALARADQAEIDGVAANIDGRLSGGYPPEFRVHQDRYKTLRARRMGIDPFGYSAALRMLADLDSGPALAAIRCPTLILAGTLDGDRPPAGVKAVADQIRDSVFREIKSGHYMPVQTPELLSDEIRHFLDQANITGQRG
ncbi:alpha/beta fold hydrolase [Aminobacter sp. MSH1]|uniref:alpha/beta fold hydrolase n=1 Tax=Aminobacter sp. MSH1 TaxID=374606 RepID=UPI000D3BE83E|nr:alpha/beta fold hydrolase [Aminobacter sp. MSH1]